MTREEENYRARMAAYGVGVGMLLAAIINSAWEDRLLIMVGIVAVIGVSFIHLLEEWLIKKG